VLYAALGALTGCASLPADPAQSALFQDVRQVVVMKERTSWVVDRVELDDIAPELLTSVCQATPEARAGLRAWVAGEAAAIGRPDEIFAETGEVDDDALTMSRVELALAYADRHAGQDCPFYLEQDEAFPGVQIDRDRFLLFLESNPNAAVLIEGDKTSLAGGGAGRLLLGYGFTDHFTVALGGEFGGRGLISTGGGEQKVGAIFTQAIPLVFRFRDLSQIYDVEISATSFTTPENPRIHPGVRVVLGTGVATLRVRGFLPLAMGQIGYEFYPAGDGQPTTHLIRVGTAFSLDIDP
jgi:hypothetical protein